MEFVQTDSTGSLSSSEQQFSSQFVKYEIVEIKMSLQRKWHAKKFWSEICPYKYFRGTDCEVKKENLDSLMNGKNVTSIDEKVEILQKRC